MSLHRAGAASLGLTAAVLLLASACATVTVPREDILALEQQRYQAMIAADVAALDRVLGEELVFTHASGRIDTKPSFLERLASGNLDYRSIAMDDVRVQSFDSSAVITGATAINVASGDAEFALDLRFTSVWVQNSSGWQLVAYQSTRLP